MEELNLNKKNGEILSSGEWNRIISALNSIIRQYNNMPDKVSDFENDLGYLTELDLLGLASESFVGNAILDLVDSGVMAGPKGDDGLTPFINLANKHWMIGNTDTGIIAEGLNGITPHINVLNKHWMIGDIDTEIVAEGQNGLDGLSPSITVTEITGGHRVVITDANDSYTFDIINGSNGNDGSDGTTPHIDPVTKHWMIGENDTNILAEGINGQDGNDGQDGTDGVDGKSAYEIAVENGFNGSASEWLASLKGQDGQNGTNGTNGSNGITPHIDPTTKHWMIGETDTGIVAEVDVQNLVTQSELEESEEVIANALAVLSSNKPAVQNGNTLSAVTTGEKYTWNNKSNFSGSYNDLTDKPTIPNAQILSNWNQSDSTALDYIKNKPTIPTVPTNVSNFVNDAGYLTSAPVTSVNGQTGAVNLTIPAAQVQSDWNASSGMGEILNKPSLSTVATTGSYSDLIDKPTIPAALIQANWNESDSNSAAYILNKPTIPAAQIQADWNQSDSAALDYIKNKPNISGGGNSLSNESESLGGTTLSAVTTGEKYVWNHKSDFSGSYNDLSNKPSIPAALIQADWNQTNSTALDYIKNKPTVPVYDSINGYDYVEIGGVKWATMNVGATSVTDYGLYFQWGDIQGYTSDQVGITGDKRHFDNQDYKYGPIDYNNSTDYGIKKYNNADNKTTLEASDDSAATTLGGNWRMPTKAEFETLINSTTISWTSDYEGSGVSGSVLTSNADSSKKLFFPAAGSLSMGNYNSVSLLGRYWTSTLYDQSTNVDRARIFLILYTGTLGMSGEPRYSGCSIRGVLDESLSPMLSKVSFTGSYNDLTNKPTIPTVPGNESASSGGNTLSVVTTGDKYNWNNKASIWSGTQAQYTALSPNYDSNTIYIIT